MSPQRIEKTMVLTSRDIRTLKARLKKTVVTIRFLKLDGSTRILEGTLSPMYGLPQRPKVQKIGATPRKTPKGTLPVWDTINGGFRSFRYNSILQILPFPLT